MNSFQFLQKYKIFPVNSLISPLSIPESGAYYPFDFGEINGEQVGVVNIFIHGPCEFNPHHSDAKSGMESWIDKHSLFPKGSEEIKLKFFKGNYASLMAYVYPTASQKGLTLSACFGAWLFVHDDFRDRPNITTETVLRMNDMVNKVLDDESYQPMQSSEFYAITSSLRDLLLGFKDFGDTQYLKQEIKNYLNENVWESENRSKKTIPNLPDYTRHRRFTSAVQAAFEVGFLILNHQLSFEERNGSTFKNVTESGCNAVGYVNDIVSLKKEIKEEIAENLVVVVKYTAEPARNWKESIEFCQKHHYHLEVRNFKKNRKGNAYEKVIDDWIKGSTVWSLSKTFPWGTPRYASWANQKVQEFYSTWARD